MEARLSDISRMFSRVTGKSVAAAWPYKHANIALHAHNDTNTRLGQSHLHVKCVGSALSTAGLLDAGQL